MKKILLACSAGMSTSILLQKMQKYIADNNLKLHVDAHSTIAATQEIEKDYDLLLLGPQVRYELPKFQKICQRINKPVDVINPADYGMANGKAVVEHALKILKIK